MNSADHLPSTQAIASTIGELSQPVRTIDAAMTCAEVETMFLADPDLRSVIVRSDPARLLNRSTFFQTLSGPLGYGRPLMLRQPVRQVPDDEVRIFAADLAIEAAAMELSASGDANVLDDVLVVLPGGELGIASVARLFHEVARRAQSSLAALTTTERRFRALVERSGDGFAILDEAGQPTYIAPGSSSVFGVHLEEWFGGRAERVGRADDVDDPADLRECWERVLRVGDATGHTRVRRRDGVLIDVEFRLRDLRDDPAVRGVVVNGRDVTERAEMHRRIHHAAHHDALTGLLNRSALLERSVELLEGAGAAGFSMVFIDLDGFKLVNDSHGHLIGDHLLGAVAERLRTSIGRRGTVGRWGGDEFLVVVEGDVIDARAVADRVASCFVRPFSLGGLEVHAEASIGVAGAETAVTAAEVVRFADAAMYAAKRAGGGRVVVWQPNLHDPHQRRHLASDLASAIEARRIDIAIQPIVSIPDRSLTGVEILARWDHPSRGPVPAAEFIELAEQERLISGLGSVVLEAACAEAARWRDLGLEMPMIDINLSPRQLHDPSVVNELRQAFARHGLPIDRLCVEITEGALIDDFDAARTILDRLRRAGVRVAIDDFGVGYSSLGYLSELPIDIVKIDRVFVDRLGRSRADDVLLRGVVQLAHSLGLEVVAEGVESEVQLGLLVDMGVDRVQGYLTCPPLSPAELTVDELVRRDVRWGLATELGSLPQPVTPAPSPAPRR